MVLNNLGNGIDGLFIENNRFNTTLVSFNFYLPLSFENITENALLIYVLSSCSQKYETFRKLSTELSMLYGASINVSVNKIGDAHLVKMAVSVIDDEFTLDGSSSVFSAVNLLESLVFEPKVKNKEFINEDIERERRKLKELIGAEINDKRLYARKRLFEEMFKNEPYGMLSLGSQEALGKITEKSLYSAWQKLLETAYVRVNVIGKTLPEGIFDEISNKFLGIQRNVDLSFKNLKFLPKTENPKFISDEMDVAQGKLVMGFSSETAGPDAYDLLVATDIFGGGPYSKLFENVREKMNLCYYCSARAVSNKGFVFVDSGVEKSNSQKAKEAISAQLEAVKSGDFSDFTLSASIKNITSSLCSYNDNPAILDSWYSSKIFTDKIKTPEQVANEVMKITREDVINAAKGIHLHTVYELIPAAGGNSNED